MSINKTGNHFISERNLVAQAYIWSGLPIVLFLGFWFRPVIAIPTIGLFLYSAMRTVMRQPADTGSHNVINCKWWLMLSAVLAYVIISGIGGLVAQIPNDHSYRNAVFYDLARHDWPVVYGEDGSKILCYYFLFWLPAAIPAKLTGLIIVGDIAQIIWATWGTWIALNFIIMRTGGRPLWRILLVFIFFNCWDWLTALFFSDYEINIFKDPLNGALMWLSTTNGRFASSANCVIYNFIYNQGIPLWVVLTLMLHTRHNTKSLLLTFSLLPLFAPIPALAFAPYIIYRMLRDICGNFTIENMTGLAVAFLGSAFLLQNNRGQAMIFNRFQDPVFLGLLMSAIFYALSLSPFLPFIWKYMRRDALYWSLTGVAVLGSMFSLGHTADLAWRISLPAIVMTNILICRKAGDLYHEKGSTTFDRKGNRRTALCSVCLYIVILIGSFSPLYLLWRTGHEQELCHNGLRSVKYLEMMEHLDDKAYNPYANNFIAEGDSFYRRYLMPER